MKKLKLLGANILFAFFVFNTAHASSISLSPKNESPELGGSVSIDLLMDFSDDPTLGGGLDILYDGTALNFVSFAFDADFLNVTDPDLTCPGAAGCSNIDQSDTVFNIAFGNFSGIGGPFLVGTVVFDTLAAGITSLMTAETTGSAGPFVSASTFAPQPVNYQGASLEVSAVPIPAAGWLFISGIFSLIAFSRKCRNSWVEGG